MKAYDELKCESCSKLMVTVSLVATENHYSATYCCTNERCSALFTKNTEGKRYRDREKSANSVSVSVDY